MSSLQVYGKFIIATAGILTAQLAFGFTAISIVQGYSSDSFWAAYGWKSQKDADKSALEGCRTNMKKRGLANLAKNCQVDLRARAPGYGAVVCGEDGCAWNTGYSERQEAVDEAYRACALKYKNCQEHNITSWDDFVGFQGQHRRAMRDGNCAPRDKYTCEHSCQNTSCTVKFNNGCVMNVTVGQHQEYKFGWDPMKGKNDWRWEWSIENPCKAAAGY